MAFLNGANDISRGIATLVGAGIRDYRKVCKIGTLGTVIGSAISFWFATSWWKPSRKVGLFNRFRLLLSFCLGFRLLSVLADCNDFARHSSFNHSRNCRSNYRSQFSQSRLGTSALEQNLSQSRSALAYQPHSRLSGFLTSLPSPCDP